MSHMLISQPKKLAYFRATVACCSKLADFFGFDSKSGNDLIGVSTF